MIKLKNENGSIVLFILISCLFFIASVACVQMYMQTKQTSIDREYRQIKGNYEANLLDEESLKTAYNELSQSKNITIEIIERKIEGDKIIVQLRLNNTNANIKTIKYGWGIDSSIETVSNWTYIEKEAISDTIVATNINIEEKYLFIIMDDKTFYTTIE